MSLSKARANEVERTPDKSPESFG